MDFLVNTRNTGDLKNHLAHEYMQTIKKLNNDPTEIHSAWSLLLGDQNDPPTKKAKYNNEWDYRFHRQSTWKKPPRGRNWR